MKTNHAIIISLLALLVGLLIGYLFGANTFPHHNAFADNDTHNHMTDHEDQSFGTHHSMGGMMSGMMPSMMGNFTSGSDTKYEQVWLESMIIHHQGALHMTEELLDRTDRPELIEFGEKIIDTQSEEIETMQTWLNNWFNQQ